MSKTIGDGIMASFADPASAVEAAMTMQRALRDYNRDQEAGEQIHIRIGLNSGSALGEPQDVFGDLVAPGKPAWPSRWLWTSSRNTRTGPGSWSWPGPQSRRWSPGSYRQ